MDGGHNEQGERIRVWMMRRRQRLERATQRLVPQVNNTVRSPETIDKEGGGRVTPPPQVTFWNMRN